MRAQIGVVISLFALGLAACSASGPTSVTGTQPQVLASKAKLHIVRRISVQALKGQAAPIQVSSVSLLSASEGYALAQSATQSATNAWLLFTSDGGRTWGVDDTLPSQTSAIQFVDQSYGFALTPTALLATVNGGRNWTTRSNTAFSKIKFVSRSDGIATTSVGTLEITRDGGKTWQQALSGSGLYFGSVSALNGPRYYALGFLMGKASSSTSLFASTDGGATWTRLFSSVESPGLHTAYLAYVKAEMQGYQPPYPAFAQGGSVTFTTPSVGWVSLFDGGFLSTLVARTVDGGRTWTYAWGNDGCAMGCNASGGGLYPAAYLDAQDAWRYGGQSIDRSTDGGATFQTGGPVPLGLPASNSVRALQFINPDLGIAGTTDGILRTQDGGKTWQRVWPQGPGPLAQISMTASGYGLAVSQGQPNLLWRTQDGGRTWQRLRSFSDKSQSQAPELARPLQISAFWAFPGGRALVVAGGTLYRNEHQGRTWQAMALKLPGGSDYSIQTVIFSSPKVGWYINSNFPSVALYSTADGGRTWKLVSHSLQAGPTNCQPAGKSAGWCINGKKDFKVPPDAWKLALMATTDGGRRFTTVGTLPMESSVFSISFYSPYAGALLESRDILLTQDAGQTFTDIHFSLPKYSFLNKVDAVSAQEIYVLTDGGRLLETRDGGVHWQQVP
ncbi:MAG: YCF48-related protein [Thermaerobacter sp.]|nr:YCF48-related protein [Thermaerobacter sp.]